MKYSYQANRDDLLLQYRYALKADGMIKETEDQRKTHMWGSWPLLILVMMRGFDDLATGWFFLILFGLILLMVWTLFSIPKFVKKQMNKRANRSVDELLKVVSDSSCSLDWNETGLTVKAPWAELTHPWSSVYLIHQLENHIFIEYYTEAHSVVVLGGEGDTSDFLETAQSNGVEVESHTKWDWDLRYYED